jgi:enoyl-CoA hydratase
MTQPLAIHWDEGVCDVTLTRPAAGNALSADLVSALDGLLDECASRRTWLMILRAEGRHFCTGFDLARLDQETDDSLLARLCRIELLLQKVHRAAFPTVAIAQGRAIGAGADLFAACTHRLAAPGTQFAFPGAAGFGLVLGTRRLVHRVGADRARQWVTTGEAISLDEAIVSGLATGVLQNAALDATDLNAYFADGPAAAAGNALLASVLNAQEHAQDHMDLAMLVRSAAIPGLKSRIADYVERNRQGR